MAIIKFSKEKAHASDAKKEESLVDLSRMQEGFSVDFDGATYTVSAYAEYDWGEGFITQTWELSGASGNKLLERETGDDIYWILSDKVDSNEITNLYDHLRQNEDPPQKINLFNTDLLLTDSGAGFYCKNGKRPGKECILWSFTDSENHIFFSLYQWGNNHFDCYKGRLVDENQFSNIRKNNESGK